MKQKLTLFGLFCIPLLVLALALLMSIGFARRTSSAARGAAAPGGCAEVEGCADPALTAASGEGAAPDLFSDTERDQGSFWNYIVHTHRSFRMKEFRFIPLILLLSWIPLLTATIVTGYLWFREDIVTRGYAGGVSGEIEELFEPSDAADLLPRQSFPKQVTLRSTSDIDTRAYIRLSVPVIEDRGAADGPGYVDALTPEINRDDFQLVSSHRGRRAGTSSVYLYRFRRTLGPGEETPPLFSVVQVPDFQCIPDFSDVLRVSGYLIQWEHFAAKDADRLARAWSLEAADAGGVTIHEGAAGVTVQEVAADNAMHEAAGSVSAREETAAIPQ